MEVGLTEREISSEKNELHSQTGIWEQAKIPPGHYLQLTVSDTEHGMPSGIMEKIFDPYFTTKAKGEGTGLGLALVHGIVKNMNGYITVESEPKKGTKFEIYLQFIEEKRWTRSALSTLRNTNF